MKGFVRTKIAPLVISVLLKLPIDQDALGSTSLHRGTRSGF